MKNKKNREVAIIYSSWNEQAVLEWATCYVNKGIRTFLLYTFGDKQYLLFEKMEDDLYKLMGEGAIRGQMKRIVDKLPSKIDYVLAVQGDEKDENKVELVQLNKVKNIPAETLLSMTKNPLLKYLLKLMLALKEKKKWGD